MIERLADVDDEIMEIYLNGDEPDEKQITAALRRVTIAVKGTPVLCGSSYRNKGVQPLLNAIVAYLPSPLDVPPIAGHGSQGRERRKSSASRATNEPFCALAFKIMADPYVGKLVLLPRLQRHARNRAASSITPPRANASAWAASCACTPTTARRPTRFTPAISPPLSACAKPRRAIRSAMRKLPSSSKAWSSRILLSRLPSSRRPRPVRRR